MKKCYIIGAGEMYGSVHPCEDDLVIAADGGLKHLEALGIVPDVIVGDFDSLGEKDDACTRAKFCGSFLQDKKIISISGKEVEIIRHPVEKDETDMYLAYEIGMARGYTEFELFGGVGGREDHTFANYCLLLRAKNDKSNVILVGNGAKTFVLKNEKKRIFGKAGATVSVFAFGNFCEGVSIRGLKYEAQNISLAPDRPLGVSNSFTYSGEGEISVENGALLVTVFDR